MGNYDVVLIYENLITMDGNEFGKMVVWDDYKIRTFGWQELSWITIQFLQ